jgi:DNA-binding beta-propeller fold protein YncE
VAVTPDETIVAAGLNRNHDGTLPLPQKNGAILFMNPVTGQITSQIDFPKPAFPSAMVFTSDGETLYALDRANFTVTPEPARLYVINVSSRAITKTIPLPAPGPGVDLALTPDDAVLFISVRRTDERGARYTELFPLDTRTSTFNGVIRLPGFNPGPIAMNPSGTRIYAPRRDRPIMVIDTATYEISEIPGVTVGVSEIYGAVVSSDGRYLLISATNSFGITIVDTVAKASLGVIEADTRIVGPVVVMP